MSITISTKLSKPTDNSDKHYNLRRAGATATTTEEKAPAKKCSAVAVITVAGRKNQLWAMCKKARDEGKIVEGSIVFAKQVKLRIEFY